MKKFVKGDRVRLAIADNKVKNQQGIVQQSNSKRTKVVLELWCRWGTFTNYFPLWFSNDQLEKI